MRLEPRDGLWPTGLAHHINGLANTDGNGKALEVFVEGYEEPGVHCCHESVQKIRGLVQDDCHLNERKEVRFRWHKKIGTTIENEDVHTRLCICKSDQGRQKPSNS